MVNSGLFVTSPTNANSDCTEQVPDAAVCSKPAKIDLEPSVLRKIAKWASKPSCGKPVWPTRFIPSKTPLTEDLLRDKFPDPGSCPHPHTLGRLLEHCSASGWPIGLIINLCVQERLYASEVPLDLPMHHVPIESKSLPSHDDVARVIQHAAKFWEEYPDSFIAIHCAYGYNRSGFCISSYCIEKCGLSVTAALDSFAYSREGGVHHEDFVQELVHRYANVQAPIQSFDPQFYEIFYTGSASAGHLQLQEFWQAAGLSEGEWMLSEVTGCRVVRHTPSGRWSIATDDSHNDLETLLIASDASESTEASAAAQGSATQ